MGGQDMDVMTGGLALPLTGMMLLTLVVWVVLFIKRTAYLTAHKVDAEQVKTPEQLAAIVPPEVAAPGNNLKNLFELPVLFYALCLYLMLVQQVDPVHVACAWAYLGLRIAHSVIHCSYNRVMHRFIVYVLSSLVLWVMVVRAFIAAI
jgi:hypothetical protein